MGLNADDDATIAAQVRRLRLARSLTLDILATRSGVSRAMLSRIERGESSPTAGLLRKICRGLDVTLVALLDGETARPGAWLARRSDQPQWRDPTSGYLRRAVSPSGAGSRIEIAEIEMPAGATVLLDSVDLAGHDRLVWVLEGAVEVARGGDVTALGTGDCLRLAVAGPIGFRNAGLMVARCAVATGPADESRRPG